MNSQISVISSVKYCLYQVMSDKIELSAVIVTWNSEKEIEKCLESVAAASKEIKSEIIVIDNNSEDRTQEVVMDMIKSNSGIKFIQNNDNKGYTKACNQGLEIAAGENILLLNPDTILNSSCIELLIKKLNSDSKTGAVAPQLLNPDSTIQFSCRTFPEYRDLFFEMTLISSLFSKSRFFSRWKMNYFSHNIESPVDQPMAAALMIKRDVLLTAGNFDERYNMFFNDVDLCKKIHDKGYKIIFYPEAKIIHEKGISIYKDRERMIKVWSEDCLKYFRKYHYNFILYNLLLISLKITGLIRISLYKITK